MDTDAVRARQSAAVTRWGLLLAITAVGLAALGAAAWLYAFAIAVVVVGCGVEAWAVQRKKSGLRE